MATWVLSSRTSSDTCLCLWHYCCALLWFYWGVCVSSSFASFFSAFRPTAFFYSVMVTSLSTACYLISHMYLLTCFRKCRLRLIHHHWLWWILLLLYSHLVHTSMSILDCPMLRDSSDQTVRPVSLLHTYFKLWQLSHTLSSDGVFVVKRYWDIGVVIHCLLVWDMAIWLVRIGVVVIVSFTLREPIVQAKASKVNSCQYLCFLACSSFPLAAMVHQWRGFLFHWTSPTSGLTGHGCTTPLLPPHPPHHNHLSGHSEGTYTQCT